MRTRADDLRRLISCLLVDDEEGAGLRNRAGAAAAALLALVGLLAVLGYGGFLLDLAVALLITVCVAALVSFARDRGTISRLRSRTAGTAAAFGEGPDHGRAVPSGQPDPMSAASTDEAPTVERFSPLPPRIEIREPRPAQFHRYSQATAAGRLASAGARAGGAVLRAARTLELQACRGGAAVRIRARRVEPLLQRLEPHAQRLLAVLASALRAAQIGIGRAARQAGVSAAVPDDVIVARAVQTRLARSHNALGVQLRRVGEPRHAAEQHRSARALFAASGDRRGEALASNNLALALADAGDEEAALVAFEHARALLRAIGDSEREAKVIANIGSVKQRAGHAEEAAALLATALGQLPSETPAYRLIERQLRRAS